MNECIKNLRDLFSSEDFRTNLKESLIKLQKDIAGCSSSKNPEKCRALFLEQILYNRVRICLFLSFVKPKDKKELCKGLKEHGMTVKNGRRKLLPHLWDFYSKNQDLVNQNTKKVSETLLRKSGARTFLPSSRRC